MQIPKKITDVELFAWIGEDEFGSGEVGIKQGMVPAGMIPIVATNKEKVLSGDLLEAFASLVQQYGKPRYLCKFKFDEIEMILDGECN